MGGDSHDESGGGNAAGNAYGAVASSESAQQVARESRHDPASQARMRSRLAPIDAMPGDSVGAALTMVTPDGDGTASHND
jgi:hypothetical protein